ncbi:MAG: hypothetical protein Q7S31_03995 [bacterium]|nr:hypothetical protein [bacterium]
MWRWILRNEALLFILLGVVLLRLPSLFEPYWYGDEGVYLTIGQALRHGVQLYSGIHDNKPPFLYLVAAMADGYQFWFRFIALVWNMATVTVFWQLCKRWFNDSRQMIWTTVIFALLTCIPLIEGNIANAELFFLLPTITAFYWLYTGRSSLVGGLILGLAALFKMPAVLELGIWPLYWLATREKGWLGKSIGLGIGAGIPLAASVAFYASQGTLSSYLIASGVQNIPYLSTWAAPVSLTWRAMVAAGLVATLLVVRKRISPKALLIGFWGVVTLFAALLSGRPYPHYLLQMAPLLAMGAAALVWGRETERYVAASLVAVLTTAIIVFQFYAYPTGRYYVNFWQWVTGSTSKWAYFAKFSPDVERNYKIAALVDQGTMTDEKIFVWGDQPMIYALARRAPVGKYTVKYHVLDFRAQAATIAQLEQTPPRYIVSFGKENELPGLNDLLAAKYRLVDRFSEAGVYRLYNNHQ